MSFSGSMNLPSQSISASNSFPGSLHPGYFQFCKKKITQSAMYSMHLYVFTLDRLQAMVNRLQAMVSAGYDPKWQDDTHEWTTEA